MRDRLANSNCSFVLQTRHVNAVHIVDYVLDLVRLTLR
jgi:hypothetical protein